MTKPDVEALDALYQKASHGKWYLPKRPSTAISAGKCREGYIIEGPEYVPDYECVYFTKEDAALIVALHNQWPSIAAALRERDELRAIADEAYPGIAHDFEQCRIERDELKAECERLREALRPFQFYGVQHDGTDWQDDENMPDDPVEAFEYCLAKADDRTNFQIDVTVGDIRKARAALTPSEKEKQK